MHQPRKFVILWFEYTGICTIPYSRPPGRRILYALRTTVLILSAERTLTLVSEYSNTASVLSSCAGSGALTWACIQDGASLEAARRGTKIHMQVTTQNETRLSLLLITGSSSNRLQYNLFLIS